MLTESVYVVSGEWENKRVFYETDSSSGYPYASFSTGRKTYDLGEAVGWLEECGPNSTYVKMNDPCVCKIEYVPLDVNDFINKRNKLRNLAKTLSDEERKVLKGML